MTIKKKKDSKKNKLRVYLAGPMEFAEGAGLNWRLEYKKALAKLKMESVIPNKEEKNIRGIKELDDFKKNNITAYIQVMRKIIDLDLNFVETLDFLVVRWEGERMSGTVHEVGHAYEIKKPVYLVTSKPWTEVPGWFLACCSSMFHSLDELIAYLKQVYI
jgi:nucleoside 2-deoxyribosyltransferase